MRTQKLVFLAGLLSLGLLFFALPMRVEHAAEPETPRYVILSAGHAAGTEVDMFEPGGELTARLNSRIAAVVQKLPRTTFWEPTVFRHAQTSRGMTT